MSRDEMIALIRAGVGAPGSVWADLGAGEGNFTRALASLLGPGGIIHAIDYAAHTPNRIEQFQGVAIHWQRRDFLTPLSLSDLDGMLMANALHFFHDQESALRQLIPYLRPDGRFLLVEYAVSAPLVYVPNPIPFERFAALAERVGLQRPVQVGFRRSARTGVAMYAALAFRAHQSGSREG